MPQYVNYPQMLPYLQAPVAQNLSSPSNPEERFPKSVSLARVDVGRCSLDRNGDGCEEVVREIVVSAVEAPRWQTKCWALFWYGQWRF